MQHITKHLGPILVCLAITACDAETADPVANPDGSGKADAPDADDADDADGPKTLPTGCEHPGTEVLTVLTVGQWEPWNYADDSGELVGFDIEYLERLMEIIGRDHEVRTHDWGTGCCEVDPSDVSISYPPTAEDEGLLPALHRGEADLAISIMSDSDRRVNHFPTSTRYGFGPSQTAFNFAPQDAAAFDFSNGVAAAVDGKTIAVTATGTNQDFYLKLLAAEEGIDLEILYAADIAPDADADRTIEQAVLDGEADATFGATLGDTALQTDGFVLDLDEDRFARVWGTGAALFFTPAIEEQEPGLHAAVDCAIEYIAENEPEFYEQLRDRYGVDFCNPTMSRQECDEFVAN